jgi:AcrR family transcriptional regulator
LQACRNMTKKRGRTAGRKPRSDAQKNRGRILDAAKEAFTRSGANTSLDDIRKQAGVGPGTLYRHFPTRDELVEAVYRTEVEKLAAAERNFAETLPPIQALRAWMLLFVDLIATKRIIAPALNTLAGRPAQVFESSHGQMRDAIRALVKRAIKSGDIRKDAPLRSFQNFGGSGRVSRARTIISPITTTGTIHDQIVVWAAAA